ncbi:MAG: helix-turn-helix transcriptional regulator [Oscillospiraceae bacterium]|nr:helix-turn-helix transcriptional regulator [Oscillospiraceae bacterium]
MELHIGENIRRLRKEHSMTQEQLAEALGVTIGAVYKWENALSSPEIRLLVELADLFGVSVDFLLGYEVQESGVEIAVERIRDLRAARKTAESAREAEKALLKYPNSFEVIYHSAQTYFLMVTQDEKAAQRCIELLERACLLFAQNPYENLTLRDLQECIAACYIGLKQYDKTIELLKKLNTDDSQNDMIGMVLAQFCQKPEEALPYLTAGFYSNLMPVFRSVIGFNKAYTQLGQHDEAFAVVNWMLHATKGLHNAAVNSFWDKLEAVLLTLLADSSLRKGDTAAGRRYLCEARATALHFDAAPQYRTCVGLNFYHGSGTEMSLDDMGDTAILAIENILERDACEELKRMWEEMKDE